MSRRINVLSVITDLGLGGGENRLLAFARTIDTKRFSHVVVTLNSPNPEHEDRAGSLRAQFEAAGIELLDLGVKVRSQGSSNWRPDHWARKAILLVQVVWRLRLLIRERHIDIVDTHLRDASIIAALAKPLTGVTAFSTQYHSWEGQLPGLVGKYLLRSFDRLITDSDARRDDLLAWVGKTPLPAVIFNGVDMPRSDKSRDDILLALGLNKQAPGDLSPIIGQVGRLVAFKGQVTLLHAAARVLQLYPNAFFLIVGFAPKFSEFQSELQALAEQLGIADRVRIGGYGGAVGDVWSLFDMHVHASHFDSLPNAILEGMSLARPAVVTEVGGIPDMVLNEQTGLVVAPEDANALAEGILRLIANPALAARLGEAAQARFQRYCTAEAIACEIETLFLETHAKIRPAARGSVL